MREDWKRLGQHVRSRRRALGFRTLKSWADTLETSYRTLGDLQRGIRVGGDTLAEVETALGWAPGSSEAILSGGEATVLGVPGSGQPAPVDDNPFTDPEERALYVKFRERLPEFSRREWIFYVQSKRQLEEYDRMTRGESERATQAKAETDAAAARRRPTG